MPFITLSKNISWTNCHNFWFDNCLTGMMKVILFATTLYSATRSFHYILHFFLSFFLHFLLLEHACYIYKNLRHCSMKGCLCHMPFVRVCLKLLEICLQIMDTSKKHQTLLFGESKKVSASTWAWLLFNSVHTMTSRNGRLA